MADRSAFDLVRLAPVESSTPEHKRLRSLLERLEKARARLEAWHGELARFAQAHAERVAPLQQRLDESRRAWALELEQRMLAGRWHAAERAVLDGMIVGLCRGLLHRPGPPDPQIKALYQRVTGGDHDAETREHLERVRAQLAGQTGLDLSDLQADSVEDLLEQVRRRVAAETARRQDEDAAGAGSANPRPRGRRSSAARKADADAAEAGPGLREVYRRLAALLHPDRAPSEATDAQRQERHDLMAQANAAYAAGDLLALLQLQMRCEPIDPEAAAKATDAQVRHVNRVLSQQLAEVEAAIRERETTFCSTYGYLPERRPDPTQLPALLKVMVREVQAAQQMLEHDQRLMRSDEIGTRRLLKQLAQEQRHLEVLRSL